MKVLYLIRDPFIEEYPTIIEEAKRLNAEVKFVHSDSGLTKSQLLQEVEDVDIIVVAIVKIDQEVIDHAPNLKYIIKFGAGYDNIDVHYAEKKGLLLQMHQVKMHIPQQILAFRYYCQFQDKLRKKIMR